MFAGDIQGRTDAEIRTPLHDTSTRLNLLTGDNNSLRGTCLSLIQCEVKLYVFSS